MKLQPYIMFNGNAREAMNFYNEALEGEITFIQTYGEAPGEYPKSPATNDLIMHANIKWSDFELMIADASPNHAIAFSDALSISIALDSVENWKKVFERLSTGGKVSVPFEKQFWGGNFGMFTDKFGISWMVNAEQK